VNAIADIGRCKIYIGPIEEAIPLVEQAIRLSPRDPGIGFWYFWIGQVHLLQSGYLEILGSARGSRLAPGCALAAWWASLLPACRGGPRPGRRRGKPALLPPFGGYGDDMTVAAGATEPPTVPGIGFELKRSLRDTAEALLGDEPSVRL
jgi:hypothetical protein